MDYLQWLLLALFIISLSKTRKQQNKNMEKVFKKLMSQNFVILFFVFAKIGLFMPLDQQIKLVLPNYQKKQYSKQIFSHICLKNYFLILSQKSKVCHFRCVFFQKTNNNAKQKKSATLYFRSSFIFSYFIIFFCILNQPLFFILWEIFIWCTSKLSLSVFSFHEKDLDTFPELFLKVFVF